MKPLREEIADSLHGGGCTGDYADYLEKADEIIEIYKQQWTEVSDQFPPAGEKVLLLDEYGTYYVGYCSRFHDEFYTSYDQDIDYVITHWMPLPEAP